jgi:chromate transport protein ChrA
MDDLLENNDIDRVTYKRHNKIVVLAALTGVVFTGVIVVTFLTSLIGKSGGEQFPKVYFLLIASILGALVNQPFRGAEGTASTEASLLILYLAWKCAIASVFAIIVNLIFISGVISGELFPEFDGANRSYGGMVSWALEVDPKTNADMAKMLIWSFVAGFSEKLVPNMVTKIFAIPEQDNRE